MNRITKYSIIGIGTVALAACLAFAAFHFDKFGKTYTLDDYALKEFVGVGSEYGKLSIDLESTDVEVLTTDSEQIKISYYNMEKDYYTVSTAAGEIKMTGTNELGAGFLSSVFGYSIPQKKVTIELPKTVRFGMDFNIQHGDADFNGLHTDEKLTINAESVNVKLQNVIASQLDLEVKYGEMNLNDVNIGSALNVKGNEVRVHLNNVIANQITVYNQYGELNMEKIRSESVICNTDSVTVTFAEMDSNTVNMHAKDGSIAGSFAGDSNAYTLTGNIKDADNNLSDFKGTGSRQILIEADSASVYISFA